MKPSLESEITALQITTHQRSRRPVSAGNMCLVAGPVLLTLLMMLPQTAPAQLTVFDGLVLHLQADQLLATNDAGEVTFWGDASGFDNSATPATQMESPIVAADAVNGHPAVRFDGVDDYLQIANAASLQPGDGDWTVFFVGKRLGASQGDFPQIIGSRPWVAGLDKGWAVSFGADGRLGSHYADGATGHDVPAIRAATPVSTGAFEAWDVEENRGAGTTYFYRNGDLDAAVASSMPEGPIDQTDMIYLGREIGGSNSRRANVDLAEVIVYNRALNETDRLAVTVYLSDKYGLGFTENLPPTISLSSPLEDAMGEAPATFTLTADANDADGSIASVRFLANGSAVATASAPPYSVDINVLTPGNVILTAIANDDRGAATTSAAVNVTVTGTAPSLEVTTGLQLHLKTGGTVSTNDNGTVNFWADQSGNDNSAIQNNEVEAPLLVPGEVNGQDVVRFDGVDDFLEIANAPSLQPGEGDWTVFFVGKRLGASQGDFPQVIGSRPWVAGLDKGWAVSFGTDGRLGSHYADGAAGHDVPAVRAASPLSQTAFQAWQIEENRTAGTTTFSLNGGINQTGPQNMPSGPIDQTDPIYLGREIGGANNRRANLDLAEVLVFNRVLDGTESEAVNAYLAGVYGLSAIKPQNQSPTVAITSPDDGSEYDVPAVITLSADASDADGSVVSVQLFQGTALLATLTSPPYSIEITNEFGGTISYTAIATDNLGASTVSAAITITNTAVGSPVPGPIDVAAGLIGVLDYADTFTVGTPERPDGIYNDNSSGAYAIEQTFGNPSADMLPTSAFSFNSGEGTTCCGYPGNQNNPDAATGLGQSGGGDWSIAYGLRDSYIVSVDAILPSDRFDITSRSDAGGGIFGSDTLSVFFRRDTVSGPPFVGLFNGSTETAVTYPDGSPVMTGIADDAWHNLAVHFDRANNYLGIYVDGSLLTNLDLANFAGGIYQDYSNGAVGMGGAGGVFWMDNAQVGAPNRLLRSLDIVETFTVGTDERPDGLYNNNATGGYNLESNPNLTWMPFSNFSFNSGEGTTCCGYPGNAGNDGAATGLAQSGGGDFSIPYGLSDHYVVQVDGIIPADRFDISTLPSAGADIFAQDSLTVFFRLDGGENAGIGLYTPGIGETDTGATTGITAGEWHRFAVQFDQVNHRLGIYVDGDVKTVLDLSTFAGGAYQNYSNGAVGIGGSGGVLWGDNFLVGPAEFDLALPGVVLSIALVDGSVVITWEGGGALQQTDNLNEPIVWNDLPDATSPYTVPGSESPRFYRVIE